MNGWITLGVGLVAAIVVNATRNNARKQGARDSRTRAPSDASVDGLDYDQSVPLDAEHLAEGGIGEAYRTAVLPHLRRVLDGKPAIDTVTDHVSEAGERYTVTAAGREYVVYSPETEDSATESWGRAAYVLFTIVNEQLQTSTRRFYAINGGNDLSGVFLTPDEAESARSSLPAKTDWPYLPTLDDHWYGQPHD